MNTINRLMTNICSDKLAESKDFYLALFDFDVAYDSDWFVQLVSQNKELELGIIDRTHETIPKTYQSTPQGSYLTFVVDSADEVFKIAKTKQFEIIQNPTDTSYGQRRLLLEDPNGMLVDVSSPIPDFQF